MVNNRLFFDTHAHMHAYHKTPDFYRPVISKIKKTMSQVRLLDLGCGDGTFMKNVIQEGVEGKYLGVDISSSMLSNAREQLKGYNIDLVTADGFSLPISSATHFDLIHLDSVLHHMIGKTRTKSKALARSLLEVLFSKLSENGFIVIEEFCYDSYIFPGFTASAVFYGLKLINFFKLDLRRVLVHLVPGLEVNFYSEGELIDLLGTYGTVQLVNKLPLEITTAQRLFLQKEFSHVSFVLSRRN